MGYVVYTLIDPNYFEYAHCAHVMKTLNKLFLILFLIALNTNMVNGDTFRQAATHYPPFTIISGNIVHGIDMEIVHKLASELDHKIELVPCPWKRCLKMMEQGEIDLLASVLFKESRDKYLAYIKPEYIHVNHVFYTKKNSSISIEHYTDLNSLVVGRELGAANFEPFDSDPGINKVDLLNNDQMLKLLLLGRVDAVVGEGTMLSYEASKNKLSNKITQQDFKKVGRPSHFTLSRKSRHINKENRLSSAMEKLRKSGYITKTINKYLTGGQYSYFKIN